MTRTEKLGGPYFAHDAHKAFRSYTNGLLPLDAKKAKDVKDLAQYLPAAKQPYYLALEDDGGELSEDEDIEMADGEED